METELDTSLVSLFLNMEDTCVSVVFTDSEQCNLKIVSISHVELDSTVMAVPVNASGVEFDKEPGIQFHLADVSEVRTLGSGKLLYRKIA